MADWSIQVESAPVREVLRRLADAGGDLRRPLDAAGASYVAATQRRFEAEAGPGGVAWPRFAASTLVRLKGTKRSAPKLLRDTSRLYRSIVHRVEADAVVIGTNVAYAPAHQFGAAMTVRAHSRKVAFRQTSAGPRFAGARHKRVTLKPVTWGETTRNLPARPFLGHDEADERRTLGIFERHLRRALG